MSSAEPLPVGTPAPAFEVTTHKGESLDLARAYAKGPVLVYFYPKADTPGCTTQACNLRDAFADLEEAGLRVIGVSADSVQSQAAFSKKYELPFTLVADTEKKLMEAFRVGSFFGFSSRQSFLVVDGRIVWRDTSASPSTQAKDALQALAEARGNGSPQS